MPLFLDSFLSICDPRKEINLKHDLLDILFLTFAAVVSGAGGWAEICEFGVNKLDWLRKFRKFEHGIPSEDTIARVIKLIQSAALNQAFIAWVNGIRQVSDQPQIAIDGKTLRATRDGEKHNALHSITVWCQESDLVLAQLKSVGKKNEHQSVLEALELLDINGAIISVDAMNSQKKIAEKVIEYKADYVFCIKNNHKNLKQEIESYFHKIQRDNPTEIQKYTEIDSGHGRIETRYCQCLPVSDWLQQTAQWAGIKSVISLERTREDKQTGKQEIDRQVYISSLPVDAQKIASVIRNHWGVENKVHWILDVVYREDDCRIRKGDGAENVAVIRRFCLNLAKLHPSKSGMKSKLRQAGWNDDFRAEILFGQNVS
jgi:predicted transposase YbfD/YdcC